MSRLTNLLRTTCCNILLGYDQITYRNDISLLELDTNIIFNDFVQPVAIPSQGANIPVNTICVITGLGRLSSGKILFYLYHSTYINKKM